MTSTTLARTYIVSRAKNSERCVGTARLLAGIGLEAEGVCVTWQDPELLGLVDSVSGDNIEYRKSVLSTLLAHKRAWSMLVDDQALSDSQWGLVVEDDVAIHPVVEPDRARRLILDCLAGASREGFVFLGICAPEELSDRRALESAAGIELVRGTGLCTHAYAIQRRRARTLFEEVQAHCRACPAPLDIFFQGFWRDQGGVTLAGVNLQSPDPAHPEHCGLFCQDRTAFPSLHPLPSAPGQRDDDAAAGASVDTPVPKPIGATRSAIELNRDYLLHRTAAGWVLRSRATTRRFALNDAAAMIWKLCEEGYGVAQIELLLAQYFPDAAGINDDVAETLRELDELGLIRLRYDPGSPAGGRVWSDGGQPPVYLSSTPGVRLAHSRNGFVLRDLPRRRRWILNESASGIWSCFTRPASLVSVRIALQNRFPGESALSGDVDATVSQLLTMGALQEHGFPGLVRVHYMGRLGNRLFSHCLGRILASKLGIGFQAPAIQGFPGTDTGFRGGVTPDPRVERVLRGQNVDMDAFEQPDPPRRICLAGFFQRYEYYRAYKEVIRDDWLWFERLSGIEPDAVVAHVRGGDVWQRHSGWERGSQVTLPVSYYRNILDGMRYSRLYLVTERSDDPVVNRLQSLYRCQVISGAPESDFRFLASAPRIIMSQSTFAWWGAWLSRAEEIHCPRDEVWAPKPAGISLWVEDESRYIFHDVDIPRPWRGDAGDVAAMLDA